VSYTVPEPDPAAPIVHLPQEVVNSLAEVFAALLSNFAYLALAVIAVVLMLYLVRRMA
jgi:hypothetical protein